MWGSGCYPKERYAVALVSTVPVVGKYQLIRKLATGGMAEVYLAKTAGAHGFEKTVVLKRILPHLAEDENFVHMFFSEAKLAAQLNHPNVVTVFDFGEDQGTYFLVMEYIDGPNLRALFRRANETKQPIPFGVVAKIISFACEGLAFAHEFIDPETNEPMNLVHRDISPDNVLLARNGGVKVVDFGIAKASNQTHHTRTGTIKGKFAYMPPEQLRGTPLDKRADIFALGIVLHELVAGVKPFDVASDATIMQAILYEKMKPAGEVRPDTPVALQRIIDRALEKDRELRYPDCRAMQADLEQFILSTGEPTGQFHLSQLVAKLASPAAVNPALPKTPSHPSLVAVGQATPGFVPGASVSQANAQAVAIELSNPSAGAAPTGPSLLGAPMPSAPRPPPMAPDDATLPPDALESRTVSGVKPQLMVMNEPSQVQSGPQPHLESISQLQSISALNALAAPPPAAAKSRGGWTALLIIGVLFLGVGGTLLGVKMMGASQQTGTPAPTPQPPVAIATPEPTPTPAPPVTPPPKPVEVAVAPPVVPAPAPVVVAAPTPAVVEAPPPKGKKTPPPRGKNQAKGKVVATAEPVPAPTPAVAATSKPAPVAEQPKPAAVVETGTLTFRVRPYATVLVDGKFIGDTPIDKPMTVPVGTISVMLINKDLNKEVKVPFEVKPGSNTFRYNLEE